MKDIDRIDEIAVQASSDPRLFKDFIEKESNYIIVCASRTAKRYISKSDDEWSVEAHPVK